MKTPSRRFHMTLLFVVGMNLIVHTSTYPLSTLLFGVLCFTWRVLYEYQRVPLPRFWVKLPLVLGAFAMVYSENGRLLSYESGSALIIMALCLKLIDRGGYSGAMHVLFLLLLSLVVQVLEHQSLAMSLFGLFQLLSFLVLVLQLHAPENIKIRWRQLLWTTGKLFLQASPLMLLLFFVFPRFSTGLSLFPQQQTGSTGFDNKLEPGSLDRLMQSNQVAFRARFPFGDEPAMPYRYWVGSRLTINKGFRWEQAPEKKVIVQEETPTGLIEQEILLEPRYKDWLFALDQAQSLEFTRYDLKQSTFKTKLGAYRSKKPTSQLVYYRALSHPEKSFLDAKDPLLKRAAEPKDARVLPWLKNLQKKSPIMEDLAKELLFYFGKEFRYTLQPGRLKTGNVGEFLFDHQLGFCEHYASAFAYLMRLAGYPAIVVVGFHGGEHNGYGNYLTITDKDAHSWTEVWSETNQIWMRFDPTSVVAPLRQQLGGQRYMDLSEEQINSYQEGRPPTTQHNSLFGRAWFQTRLAVDMVSTRWNYFLLNYDQTMQKRWFNSIGLNFSNQHSLLIFSFLLLVSYFFLIKKRTSRTPVSKELLIYNDLCELLDKKGLTKLSHEGPKTYLERAGNEIEVQKEQLVRFSNIYQLLRYKGSHEKREQLQELKQRYREIKKAL